MIHPYLGSFAKKAVTGIAYRMDTNQDPPQLQIIVDTESAGWHAYYMTTNRGTNWLRILIKTPYVSADYGYDAYPPPVMNSLAGTPAGDVFYSTFRNSGKTVVYTVRNSNLWTEATSPYGTAVGKSVSSGNALDTLGVSALGRIVGRRVDSGDISRNVLYDWVPKSATQYQWTGLDGTTAGQAWSINEDGSVIFGWSPRTDDPVSNYAYKKVLSGSSPNADAPGSGITEVSVNALPESPRTGGSTTRTVPFGCTADGKYAVGYTYASANLATLWDTSDPDPANWKATDLTALAAAHGLGVPELFTSLARAYSVGTNDTGDLVITGYGAEAGTGYNRAFLMTVPKSIAAAGFTFRPRLTISGSTTEGFTLSFYCEPGGSYAIEHTTALEPSATWELLTTGGPYFGGQIVTATDSPTDTQQFYRVRLQ